jgi:hypothetical protein
VTYGRSKGDLQVKGAKEEVGGRIGQYLVLMLRKSAVRHLIAVRIGCWPFCAEMDVG